MALFRGIQEYIDLDANNITLVFDSGNIVNISGNIFLYPPQGHPISYNCSCERNNGCNVTSLTHCVIYRNGRVHNIKSKTKCQNDVININFIYFLHRKTQWSNYYYI